MAPGVERREVMATVVENEPVDRMVTEDARVLAWRTEQFGQLGFSAEMASLLAGSPAELNTARGLARDGCPLDVVARILL